MTLYHWRLISIVLLLAAGWTITVAWIGWWTFVMAIVGAVLWIDTHPWVRRQ